MFRLVHAMPVHPSLCLPRSYPTSCCYCYYCFYFTSAVALLLLLINFYEQELFPGAAELTTQLFRLASILWLPLCRINKLGNNTHEDCCDPLYLWVIKQGRGRG